MHYFTLALLIQRGVGNNGNEALNDIQKQRLMQWTLKREETQILTNRIKLLLLFVKYPHGVNNPTMHIHIYIFYIVTILVNDKLDTQCFFYTFISILYMFPATSCSSSGESIVSIQHLVCVSQCRWPSGMQVGKFLPDLHTRRSPTQSDTNQMLYWYNWFSWWWARGCSKHIQNWNKHIEKEPCVKLVIYKNYTEMPG
jgi:hypothetical protein